MIIKCPECGHQVSDRARTCPSCGIDIAGKITRCPDCGEVIFKDQASCPICHRPINEAFAASQDMTAVAASTPPSSAARSAAPASNRPIPVAPPAEPKPKPKRNGLWSALILAFVIALIIVLVGVYFYQHTQHQNEERAYENAMLSNEPNVLQSFLDMYTTAPQAHRDSVQSHLELLRKTDLDWANAVVSGSRSALEQYIKLHPDNIHVPEAKLKIDSLDWLAAKQENTSEAYQRYMENHNDGEYYDEARNEYDRLESLKVSLSDKDMITRLFAEYFRALSEKNETSLTSTITGILSSFLHKENATKSDVIRYMYRLYEAADVHAVNFSLNDDWKIDKTELADGTLAFDVSFSVDQRTERDDTDKERFCTYKVTARVTSDGKIENLNMKKIVQ